MRRVCIISWVVLSFAAPAAAQSPDDFQWTGRVVPGKTIEIKGVNGDIRAELASGGDVEVRAAKRGRRDDPSTVRIEMVQEDGNVTICAVYPEGSAGGGRDGRRPNECRVGDAGHIGSRNNDVEVDFVVRVPAGVAFAGRTVNGRIDARGLRGAAHVQTVNGRIDLSTTGVGSAKTVNGSIEASVGSSAWTGLLEFQTVNGSIDLRLPKETSTNLHAKTLNGRFESDFAVTVQRFGGRNRRVDGVIGAGGRDLELSTVNGGVFLRFVTP